MSDRIWPSRPLALDRRSFLKAGLAAPVLAAMPASLTAQTPWRTFEILVRVDVLEAKGPVTVWLPLALSRPAPYQRAVSQTWKGNTTDVDLIGDPASGAPMLIARWPAGVPAPSLTLTMAVQTTGHRVSLKGETFRPEPAARLEPYLRPTALIPITGIVRDTAVQITRGLESPLARAQAIYEWIVENTFRDPKVEGCGTGDIRFMLESGSLGGKCADLNALFVGLCRSVRLPARDLYGIRVAASNLFKSLGKDGDITSSQHCRAEVYVDGIGWIPADPADVRKVVLEEQPGATLNDVPGRRARERMFGAWEMNWIAFNDAHDIALPGSKGPRLPFFMYPQAEVEGVRRNSLDAPAFRYQILSTEAR